MSPAIAFFLLLLGALLIGMFMESLTKRTRRNRYRKVLPPPSPLCSRGFDYK
jgi:hypothetical protein